jgi:hypothetical protein
MVLIADPNSLGKITSPAAESGQPHVKFSPLEHRDTSRVGSFNTQGNCVMLFEILQNFSCLSTGMLTSEGPRTIKSMLRILMLLRTVACGKQTRLC